VPGDGERRRLAARLNRDVVMVGLAVLSIVVLAVQELVPLDRATNRQLLWLDLGIVAIFWVEYLWRLREAPRRHGSRWEFVKANWYELPGMVPILPGMGSMAGVRVLRLLRILRVLRLVGALRRFERFDRAVQRFTTESKLGYIALFALSLIVLSSTLAWLVEPQTFRDDWVNALWWGAVTVTTVGYGDFFPVTGPGRAVALVLMFLGVALIGSFAATLSSFLVESRFEANAKSAPVGAPPALAAFSVASELERLARLHDQGKLSDGEFAAAKQRLLG
jgi:voltage-gated potassium channel